MKNYGNDRQDPLTYPEKIEKDLEVLVKNERRFRRDFKILNNIDDKEIEEEIEIIEKSLETGLIKSLDKMMKALYALKKYKILGYEIFLSEDKLDYLIEKLNSHIYGDNFSNERFEFLMKYMGEIHGKQ